MLNALTIDVEEHFQVHAFASAIRQSEWETQGSRVVANTRHVLQLLAEYQIHATFFVLGWVADRYPALVEEIALAGHEIGTHGYWHKLVYEQSPDEFAQDLADSIAAIQRAWPAAKVLGYRAPAFSITTKSLWALPIMQKSGLRYDASIFPITLHDRYGIPQAERFAHRLTNGLWEFPASTLRLGRQNIPVAGGGYFRLYPLCFTRYAIQRLNQQQQPAMIYLHPWEFDPEQPRTANIPLTSRFRHYVNLHTTAARLKSLFKQFRFAPINDVFAHQLASG